jgi:predicted metal-binding protein
MAMHHLDEKSIIDSVKALAPTRVAAVDVASFVFDPYYRTLCEANHCGHYNKKWTCPPHVGAVEDLVTQAMGYKRAVVYQFVGSMEHSFDLKGILAAGKAFGEISKRINVELLPGLGDAMLLGAGPCQYCESCSFADGEPCRNPGKAIRSLEANCVDVKALAGSCGMQYINGQNTVTLFGSILYLPWA